MARLNEGQFHQPRLPGTSEPKQMALFHTAKAGDLPANIYRRSYHPDAPSESNLRLNPDEQRTLSDPNEHERGVFFDWDSPANSSERQFLAYGEAHEREVGIDQHEKARGVQSQILGYDKFPEQVNPDLDFEDLIPEEGVRGSNFGFKDPDEPGITFRSPEGSEIAKVTYDEDEWGPNVHEAEVNPLYKGRGWTKPAMTDFVGQAEGVVHAGGFTHAGSKAFRAKGIPTDEDLNQGLSERVEQRVESDIAEGHVGDNYLSRMNLSDDYMSEEFESYRGEMEQMQKQGVVHLQQQRRAKKGHTVSPKQFGSQEKFF